MFWCACLSQAGSYNELMKRDGAFAEFLRNYAQAEEEEEEDEDEDGDEEEVDYALGPEEEPALPDDSTAIVYGDDLESVVRQRGRREQLEKQRSEQVNEQVLRSQAFSPASFSPTE